MEAMVKAVEALGRCVGLTKRRDFYQPWPGTGQWGARCGWGNVEPPGERGWATAEMLTGLWVLVEEPGTPEIVRRAARTALERLAE